MSQILVPTDFSETADNAYHAAKIVAGKFGAEILLLNVIEGPTNQSFNVEGETSYGGTIDDLYVGKMVPIVKSKLQAYIDNSDGIGISSKIKVGNTYSSIMQLITESGCNLIVMGTQGSSGLDELFIGSNAEKVVRMAGCPVLSLKTKVDESAFENIAVATDLGEGRERLWDQLNQFQTAFNSKLHLVKINTPNNFQSDRVTNEQLKSYAEKYNVQNCTLNIFNDPTEGEGIMHFAQEINAGMIAMATHGRTGLSHLLTGSIAEDIVNHAKRPVLTVNVSAP